jgi:hypothetical protein
MSLFQILVEEGGKFVPWETVELPDSAAAGDRIAMLQALHGKSFSAQPAPPPSIEVPLVVAGAFVRRNPVAAAAFLGALGSGPVWWLIFHFL